MGGVLLLEAVEGGVERGERGDVGVRRRALLQLAVVHGVRVGTDSRVSTWQSGSWLATTPPPPFPPSIARHATPRT